MPNNYKLFLSLVRLGIGHRPEVLPIIKDWNVIEALANEHGLSAILLDAIDKLPNSNRPPKEVLLNLIGEVMQDYEQRFINYRKAITSLAGIYEDSGIKMMVLKGFACSLDWPNPNHRPCGDIDIWLFGRQKDADRMLQDKGIAIDKSHHHHTVFCWQDYSVENHYDFINVYRHQYNVLLEKTLKELGKDDSCFVEIEGQRVYLPSPNLHALFLICHALNHFVSVSVNMRQLLDWAFFVEKHTKEVDWEWLTGILKKFHMMDFFNCINAICVENLDFDVSLFPVVQFLPDQKDMVLNDILAPKPFMSDREGMFARLANKYKRWNDNAWKQEMCYGESRWSSFWSGVWVKLSRPSLCIR